MMTISPVDLMELMVQAVGRAADASSASEAGQQTPGGKSGWLVGHDEIQSGSIESLESLLCGQPDFLTVLAKRMETCDRENHAQMLVEIRRFLAENGEDLSAADVPLKRLTGLVYPVV